MPSGLVMTQRMPMKSTIAGFRGSVKGFGYDVRFSQLVSRNQAQYVNEIFQTTTDTLPQAETSRGSYVLQLHFCWALLVPKHRFQQHPLLLILQKVVYP